MTKYDVILDQYTVVASMPAPRSNFATALVNGQGYIIGGFESANTAARSIPNVRRLALLCHGDAGHASGSQQIDMPKDILSVSCCP